MNSSNMDKLVTKTHPFDGLNISQECKAREFIVFLKMFEDFDQRLMVNSVAILTVYTELDKIQAIKLVKALLSCGLKSAKRYVDAKFEFKYPFH